MTKKTTMKKWVHVKKRGGDDLPERGDGPRLDEQKIARVPHVFRNPWFQTL
jgi:hypothetical protein